MNKITKRLLAGVGALAAAGAVTAGIAGAAKSGDEDAKGDGAATGRHGSDRGHHRGPGGPGGPGRHHGTPLTGDAAEKAKAAALEELPGAKILEVFAETEEVEGARYEVHAIRKDGRPAEVILDAGFKVLETLDRGGPGPGGHRGPGGPGHGTPLTGEKAEKAREAALAAVPGGTVRGALEIPEGREADAAYVVFVARKSGRPVVVLLDGDFAVVRKLTGPPRGGHGHGRGGPERTSF